MMRFQPSFLILGLSVLAFNTQASDDWVLKSKDLTLAKITVEDSLIARGARVASLDSKQRQALLEELFIRESLLAKQASAQLKPEQLAVLDKQVEEFRKGQLSRLLLEALSLDKAPDFEPRAKELYEARKATDYYLPLRLRVRVLEKNLGGDEVSVRKQLEAIKQQVTEGKVDFKAVVLAESDAVDKKLTEGDSFWFYQGQKLQAFYDAAATLSAEKPLSEVLVFEGKAYLMQFIGRQEVMQQTYAEVKDKILLELTEAYKEEQRKLLLEQFHTAFSQAEIAPAYQ
ncbi:peptidylprolyl isomerase [uncultured Thiothrix sp.]|uniref:peptidylprolyl isomerase n=1 Tax=uncultured Thiothrix sp. TaxID=223185 RepID=UPI0026291C22|nr:peptidylprolyl isomerase [uncultured Thiothrix sp.]HMT94644.1 peptidylprolyl isomerase [Thiolinea sp.]